VAGTHQLNWAYYSSVPGMEHLKQRQIESIKTKSLYIYTFAFILPTHVLLFKDTFGVVLSFHRLGVLLYI